MASDLPSVIAERVRRVGPLPFDEVLDIALYHPDLGFYSGERGAGRDRDFLTSPEVGPLYGAVVARALDTWWDDLGRPDPFVVTEAGAGTGTLAKTVLAAGPECGPALRYVLVEQSQGLRAVHAGGLALEPASFVLGPSTGPDPDLGPQSGSGSGPMVTSLAELPAGPLDGVVLANELLDNLPFRLLQRNGRGWEEVRIDDDLAEVLVPAASALTAEADGLAPEAPAGGRIPVQHRAASWLRAASACLGSGRVVVVDYADSTPGLARRPWTEWVRTYRSHGRGGHPLSDLGAQDVTCEVAVDQLARVRAPVSNRSQAEFLRAHGLEDLVAAARESWEGQAAVGDLAAVAARSRVTEAAALTDPSGLGGFRVLEWAVPGSPGRGRSLRPTEAR